MADTTPLGTLFKVSFSGDLETGEIFEHGMWMSAEVATTDEQVNSAASAWLTDFLGQPALSVGATDIRHLFDPSVHWTRVSVRAWSPTTDMPLRDPVDSLIDVSGAGSGMMPLQCTLCVTLWNGRTLGRRRYNRFFLPPMETSVLASTGRVFAGLPNDIATAVKVAGAATGAGTPPVSVVYYGTAGREILGLHAVKVGDVVDTQRRRRNALVEVYSTVTF